MIQITQDEVNAFNIISQQATLLQGQVNQVIAAQKAIISLLEIKYNAAYDEKTGQFEIKKIEVN